MLLTRESDAQSVSGGDLFCSWSAWPRRRRSTSRLVSAGDRLPARSSTRSKTRGSAPHFASVWDAAEPRAQLNLAVRFVDQYPRSILLREAYELAARASVTTGDLPAGLDWAKRSLRLMPENPFLLVMIADIAARHGDLDLAVTSARDALGYLEHAEAPSPITPADWPQARARLRAAALYVVGRVAASRGRVQGSGTGSDGLSDAESRRHRSAVYDRRRPDGRPRRRGCRARLRAGSAG